MATILRLDSFATANLKETSKIDVDVAIGATTVTLQNSNNFVKNDYVVLRSPGTEKSEVKLISDVTGNVITIPATVYSYSQYDEAWAIKGNQIKLYKAANVDGSTPDDTDFSILTTETIFSDKLYIDYTDSTGGSDYWYKQTYYNETTTTESAISLATATRGGGYGRYVRLDRVRSKAGLQDNYRYTDVEINESVIEAQSDIDSALKVAGYTLPLDSVPPFIAKLTRELAVADLLGEAYDSRAEGTNKSPLDRMAWVEEQLEAIRNRDKVLVDEDGNIIPLSSRFDYQPDSSVSDFYFKRDMEF